MSKESYESNQTIIRNNIAAHFAAHEATIVAEFGQSMYNELLANRLEPNDAIKIARYLEE